MTTPNIHTTKREKTRWERPASSGIAIAQQHFVFAADADLGWAFWLAWLSFLGGLAATTHCAVMCGPLLLARRRPHHWRELAQIFLGRLLAYGLLGAFAGRIGQALVARLTLPLGMLLMLVMGAGYINHRRNRDLIPLRRKAPTIRTPNGGWVNKLGRAPMLFGAAAALLPCGTLYAALLAASGTASAALGAISMASFASASSLGVVFAYSGFFAPLIRRFPRLTPWLGVLLPALAWSRTLWLLAQGRACHV